MRSRALATAIFWVLVNCACSPDHTSNDFYIEPHPNNQGGAGGEPFSHPEEPFPGASLNVGEVKVAERAPAPLSGGTLAVGLVGAREVAVVGDPDAGKVFVVDLATSGVTALPLEAGEQPGRVMIENSVAHVIDRGKGALLTIPLDNPSITERRAVCAAPRGLAYDKLADQLWVACQGGELQVFPASGGGVVAQTRLANDLRDVVVSGDEVLVSRFRSAEILVLDRGLQLVQTLTLPAFQDGTSNKVHFSPSVAWRMIPREDGGAVVVHQRSNDRELEISQPQGYGVSSPQCPGQGAVHTAFTLIGGGKIRSSYPIAGVLPLDIAAHKSNLAIAAGAPDAVALFSDSASPECQSFKVKPESLAREIEFSGGTPPSGLSSGDTLPVFFSGADSPQAVSVAFSSGGVVVIQGRLPSTLRFGGKTVLLDDSTVDDTGHRIFHMNSGRDIACASCHPEGGDDGHTWHFEKLGPRRTQSLRGGLKGSEPFHWSGDMSDAFTLMTEVFSHRMGGGLVSKEYATALLNWVDQIPLPTALPVQDAEAVARGKTLFESAEVGCASCHSGARLSNNATVNVGTGEAFQVPSLRRIALRAPLMHDGCAMSLQERFSSTSCGGGDQHGKTSQLSPAQLADLIAYLESL